MLVVAISIVSWILTVIFLDISKYIKIINYGDIQRLIDNDPDKNKEPWREVDNREAYIRKLMKMEGIL